MDFSIKLLGENKKPELPNQIWDVIIIGAGPAGYTAGIYATRYNLKVLIIGAELGGLVVETPEIENYPGFKKIEGEELMQRFKEHYIYLGGYLHEAEIVEIKKENDLFELKDRMNNEYKAKTVIFATGTRRRKLNIEGEDKFVGKGVSYCATCDAAFTKGKKVIVIGGGDSAFTSAILLKQFADEVYIIHRRKEFRAQPALVDKAKQVGIKFITPYVAMQFLGDDRLKKVVLENRETKEQKEMEIDYAFIEIGHIPNTTLVSELGVNLDEHGYIIVDSGMKTNIRGLFAAGDITTGSNKLAQIITACAEGAIAAESVFKYLKH